MAWRAFSWNINGLRAVLRSGALTQFITEFAPDILALQETKIKAEQLATLELEQLFPDYQMFWSFAERKGYAGTALWVRREYSARPIVMANNLNLRDRYGCVCEEGRLTAIEIDGIVVASLYAPNGKEDLSRIPLREQYDAHLNQLFMAYPHVLLLGDFNVANEPIDVANAKTKVGTHGFTAEERRGFKNYLAAGFHDVWREANPAAVQYTWWSFRVRNYDPSKPRPGWRIDYALVKGLTTAEAAIHPAIQGSDHCPISVEVQNA